MKGIETKSKTKKDGTDEGVEGKKERESCRLWGVSLNETRWGVGVCGGRCLCAWRGLVGYVWEYVRCSVVPELDKFGILEFGPETRNFHPGGYNGGVLGAEVGRAGGLYGERNGPSFSLPTFPPLHTFIVQLSVSTLALSDCGRTENVQEAEDPGCWSTKPPEEHSWKKRAEEAWPVSKAHLNMWKYYFI